MKLRFVLLAALLAACDTTPVSAGTPAPAPTTTPAIAVASVRMVAPTFYTIQGSTTASQLHIVVRQQPKTVGFQTLDSGTFLLDADGPSGTVLSFSTVTGYRYLIVVYPVVNGADDSAHASFTEVVAP